jgi:DNA-directed RNA polymerase subunit M/transcription elongation factor TFIIS
MADIQVVFLGQKGEIRQGKLKNMSQEGFMTALKKKEVPSLIGKCSWKQKQKTLYFFGYIDGKSGNENQHHLPNPLEGMTFYGDILVLCSASPSAYDKPSPLKTADYESFYTSNLEGDDDATDSEEGDEDEEEDIADVDADVGVEEDDALAGKYEDAESETSDVEESDVEEVILEKPVRRVRKVIVTAVQEEPEVEADSTWESSPYRTKVLNVIRSMLGKSNDSSSKVYMEDSDMIDLEEVIYKKACDTATYEEIRKSWNLQAFRDVYLGVSRRVIGNLAPNTYIKNKNLIERFYNKELTLEEIVKQNYYELCPENWQEMVDRQAKREKIQLEGDFSRATDKWMCNGCKQRKCTYYELQTRSADEPMTIFIHCLNCGKRWTQ